ncbi:MAG: hypothetical protein ABI972_24670, partial [Acidobacteriota bacterium]
MTANPRWWSLMCLLALLMCLRGHGQELQVLQRVEAVLIPGGSYVDLTFSGSVKVSSAERASLYSLGDGTDEAPLVALPAEGLGGRPRMLRVFLTGNPPAGHARLRVCLGAVEVGGSLLKNVCGEGRIVRDLDSEFAHARAVLESLPKLQQEKSLFASAFLSQAVRGPEAGAGTVGAADISLVRGDSGSNDLNYYLRL